ncbi:hypothetical protein KJ865_17190, partial [Myxococcota bacterium]|nr:hypothetical protein [Myxococcota bacterium]
MKQITLLIASFLLISLCASVAGATTITGQGSATMQLPRLLTPTQSIFPKLNFSKAATIKAPVIVTAESVPFGTRAWTNDPETEPAPPPPPTGYQGSPAQPAPMAPANAPYEESNILLYTV